MTPREAIARALWLREGYGVSALDWPEFFAWFEREAAKENRTAADNSAIGHCVRRAEKILRLLEAAGLKVEEA